jgi:DNA helicase-2/ATP-dependent DNA helicase PcrA
VVVLEALRSWRRDRAAADAVPAYVVASDATLRALVERRPRTLGELLGVPGIGPAKLERYGQAILDVLGGTMP